MRRIYGLVAAVFILCPAALSAQAGDAARLHRMINAHRDRIGCAPLAWHAPSAGVAMRRSADMHEHGYFDHVSPDGRTVFDELREAGVEARSMAENIALTQAGSSSALELWLESPPHRRNIDDCALLAVRAGLWTQILLAQPRRVIPSRPSVAEDPGVDPAIPRR